MDQVLGERKGRDDWGKGMCIDIGQIFEGTIPPVLQFHHYKGFPLFFLVPGTSILLAKRYVSVAGVVVRDDLTLGSRLNLMTL